MKVLPDNSVISHSEFAEWVYQTKIISGGKTQETLTTLGLRRKELHDDVENHKQAVTLAPGALP